MTKIKIDLGKKLPSSLIHKMIREYEQAKQAQANTGA